MNKREDGKDLEFINEMLALRRKYDMLSDYEAVNLMFIPPMRFRANEIVDGVRDQKEFLDWLKKICLSFQGTILALRDEKNA